MIASNTTIEQLNKALELTNKQYKNNIDFKRLESKSASRQLFTLTVKDTSKPGARRGTYQFANKDGSRRKIASACWHVHGDFFDNLLEINPDAVIRTGQRKIDINGGNWEDWNIGSMIYPMYYSEACECNN